MVKIFKAYSDQSFDFGSKKVDCALGRHGTIAALDKREGDLKSPIGIWPIRYAYYRPDRLPRPETGLKLMALTPEDGWCDDPQHALYNQAVRLPFEASHEKLWRDDHVYDLIIVLGHNDNPIVPGLGSAIFAHVAREDFRGTEGCVALRREHVLELLALGQPGDAIEIV